MPQNIRAFVPGGTFFFTVTLLERCWKTNDAKGGMRYAFPPYGLWFPSSRWGTRLDAKLCLAQKPAVADILVAERSLAPICVPQQELGDEGTR